MDVRVRALESLLIEKGYVDPVALDELIDAYQTRSVRTTEPVSSPVRGATLSSGMASPRRNRGNRHVGFLAAKAST